MYFGVEFVNISVGLDLWCRMGSGILKIIDPTSLLGGLCDHPHSLQQEEGTPCSHPQTCLSSLDLGNPEPNLLILASECSIIFGRIAVVGIALLKIQGDCDCM